MLNILTTAKKQQTKQTDKNQKDTRKILEVMNMVMVSWVYANDRIA